MTPKKFSMRLESSPGHKICGVGSVAGSIKFRFHSLGIFAPSKIHCREESGKATGDLPRCPRMMRIENSEESPRR
jgi:hypothetical protein